MKTLKKQPTPSYANKCDRRSFLLKGAYTSLGLSLLAGLNSPALTFVPGIDKSKEDIFKQLDDLVDKYFPVYGTCSQTSCAALTETFNIEATNVVKALAPFPGIALRGETCGAVSGCIASISLAYEGEKENQGSSLGHCITFCSKFENEYGSTRCKDIIEGMTKKKYELSKPEDYEVLRQEGAYADCVGLVKKSVHIAAEIILEKS